MNEDEKVRQIANWAWQGWTGRDGEPIEEPGEDWHGDYFWAAARAIAPHVEIINLDKH